MSTTDVVIRGAREHNLRNVDLILPRNQLICMTGVSGSGKSSLAFDTVYAEGQRRYIESLSSFARQFLGQMPKPEVDLISGLSPSISISQKSAGNNPRSTVGTITEILDYLRVLFARVGRGYCPQCGLPVTAQSREQILASILARPAGSSILVLAPLIRRQKGEYRDLFENLRKQGFARARVDGQVIRVTDAPSLDRQMRHDIEVIVDRLEIQPGVRPRLAEAVDLALKMGDGTLLVAIPRQPADDAASGTGEDAGVPPAQDTIYSAHYACVACGVSFQPPTPQMFSFNSPQGMCPGCDGLGEQFSFDHELLLPDDSLSFKRGCIVTLGRWKDIGRWRRHRYQGVADTVERQRKLEPGTMLDTPWRDLAANLRQLWLWGTGDLHITYTWRGGSSPIKYGGSFAGIIPELKEKYRELRSRPKLRQLEQYMRTIPCPECGGQRLGRQARSIRIKTAHPDFGEKPEKSLPQVSQLSVRQLADFFEQLDLDDTAQFVAADLLKEIRQRIGFLLNVGLDYLTLDRPAPTLSGGETQRIRLASQIGSGLVGVLYILDEPSIGLHARDNQRLLQTLCRLRDMGNTVLVVEHDEDTMRAADQIVDFGPGPGVRGGRVVASGSVAQVIDAKESITGKYLSGELRIETPAQRRDVGDQRLRIVGAAQNNLKNIDVEIPLGNFVCVTGVSGSGKSSLVNDILIESLRRDLNRGLGEPGVCDRIEGLEYLDKLIAIDQSPIGRTPRSNPATYIKLFDEVRRLYARLPESKLRGYDPGRFSFNVARGRCDACEGNGANKLEMDFLADIWVTCPQCQGRRYNHETCQVRFKGKSIADVLDMDVQQALDLFENVPPIQRRLQTLHDVGLDYIKLGQPSPTLSGGEAQRIKLARELVKRSTGQTLYLLDEPTTGLHFADIQLLLKVLHGFVDAGNTVLIVEHNLDVVKTADWVIDLGPEGGAAGGRIVAEGTPEDVANCGDSYTGQVLAPLLGIKQHGSGKMARAKTKPTRRRPATANKIRVQCAEQHNLKSVDVELRRDAMTVFCGPSGSGKSSLAMDTIYAEGQRRYVESLSSYARQFVAQMQKPKVESIEGLSPAIAIEQKNLGHTPRSTVGTVTEIYDYLRILMARLGTPYCPDCDVPVGTQTVDQIVDKIFEIPDGTRVQLLAPIEVAPGQDYATLWNDLRASGYVRIRINGQTHTVESPPTIDRRRRYQVEVVVDRVVIKRDDRGRITDSVENCLAVGKGVLHVAEAHADIPEPEWTVTRHSQHLACDTCGRSFEQLSPHCFSFNSPLGWCPVCEGLGTQRGADLSHIIADAALSLSEGALALWPNLNHPVSRWMLEALSRGTGIPLDVPFENLATRHRRMILRGCGNKWFDVPVSGTKGDATPMFRFQFGGLYHALEEACRVSPSLRYTLAGTIEDAECSACGGSRLREDASAVRFQGKTLDELCKAPLGALMQEIDHWTLSERDRRVAGELLREVRNRVSFLNDVGLHYLTLARGAATLSNGEAQRIRLASQLGSGLCGVLYVLDEPTIGLHPRDNARLLSALHRLRDLGNTLIVVEHDREVIQGSDYICDFGPAAGKQGGELIAQGTPRQIASRRASLTGQYLSGKKSIAIPSNRRMRCEKEAPLEEPSEASTWEPTRTASGVMHYSPPSGEWLEVVGARHNNLKDIHVKFPLATLCVVTGPSGSGKSSLVHDILYRSLAHTLHMATTTSGQHEEIRGIQYINKVIQVDQQALGNSPASNPATYTGTFDLIRELFSQLPEAKVRGYSPRRFSFNVPGGRCDHCEGNGQLCIEMHFLPDVWIPCDMCDGKRYNPETLAVKYHGHSISDVLEMSCGEAVQLFANVPRIRRILQTLCDVGLDYVALGQPAPTLSGGEAQRVKLAAQLARPDTGRTLFLLDEPTTGLHFEDLVKLVEVVQRLVDLGNTVVLIEHNLDVIKSADWVIDLGPEAGHDGGSVVATGPPEAIVAQAQTALSVALANDEGGTPIARSYTGEALLPVLEAGPYVERPAYDPSADIEAKPGDLEIEDVGRTIKMPWEVDGRLWHTQDRVGRRGEPCRWDGRILEAIVDRIEQLGEFAETDWNSRGVVEIAATKKTLGWFFHAITGETWLLKLKFRVARGTFRREQLVEQFGLKTLNQLDQLPVYGNEPRVTCKQLRGPWQEVQLKVHSWDEIDTPGFWAFLEQAVASFQKFVGLTELSLEDHMPWVKLGQRWHFMRKGFSAGKVMWDAAVLQDVHELLQQVAPDGTFQWNQKVLFHLVPTGCDKPWATVITKRAESVDLVVRGPKDAVSLGRICRIGWKRELDATDSDYDVIKFQFRTRKDLRMSELKTILKQHLDTVLAQDE